MPGRQYAAMAHFKGHAVKKHLAALASVVALVCAPGFALGADAPMAPADPAVIEATKQMMASMKIRDVMLTSMRQAQQQMPAQMKSMASAMITGNANLTNEQKAEALKRIDQVAPKLVANLQAVLTDPALIDEMLAEMVPLYAETYTLDEIHQLSAFYASPLGQKMLANMPSLMSRSMQISQRVMMPRIQKIMVASTQDLAGK